MTMPPPGSSICFFLPRFLSPVIEISTDSTKFYTLIKLFKGIFWLINQCLYYNSNIMESIAKDDKGNELVPEKNSRESSSNGCTIVYVLGGPGSGKSTQCSKIVRHFGFCHLSVGDLLQAEVDSGSDYGKMIQDLKKEGKLVPSDIVVKVLEKAMQGSKNKKFLIDGFPRSQENLDAAEKILKIDPEFVLFFDCSEEEMIKRLLNRNQGRVDDNIESIKKRLKVYFESTLPIINYYSSKGKIRKINAERPIEEVFDAVKDVFSELKEASMECKSSTY